MLYKPEGPHIRLRFLANSDIISEAIKLVSRSPYITHVELQTGEDLWTGARSSGGVQERPTDYCKPIWERRYAIPCSQTALDGVISGSKRHIGEKYDFLNIVGLLFQHDMHTVGRSICSQFVFDRIWDAGTMLLNVLPEYSNLITPEMLHLSPVLIGKCYFTESK